MKKPRKCKTADLAHNNLSRKAGGCNESRTPVEPSLDVTVSDTDGFGKGKRITQSLVS